MLTGTDPFTMESDGWIVRVQPPLQAENRGVLLLLHGWTGDENVMWIFTRKLDKRFWLLAPRAPIKAPSGGYGWISRGEGEWPTMMDLEGVATRLAQSMPVWFEQLGIPQAASSIPLGVMGFSQGAAMAYALTAYYPEYIDRLAALAGFLPAAPEQPDLYPAFAQKNVFIAHGTHDETIPVEMAQNAVHLLQANGAQIHYCESETGHKLSLNCLSGLEVFFNAVKTPPGR